MIPYGKRHPVVLRWIPIKNLSGLLTFLNPRWRSPKWNVHILRLYAWWKTIYNTQWANFSVDELKENKTTTYGTCRSQRVKMASRSLFLFPGYKRHFVFFYTVIIIHLFRTYVLWIGRPEKCRYNRWNFTNMLFLSEDISISGLQAPFCCFSSNHCLFASGIILWIGRSRKYRSSRWNFTNILFLSEAISISGLQAPFLFLTVIIIYMCRTYVL